MHVSDSRFMRVNVNYRNNQIYPPPVPRRPIQF